MPKDHNATPRSHYVTSTLSRGRGRAFVPPPLPADPQTPDLMVRQLNGLVDRNELAAASDDLQLRIG